VDADVAAQVDVVDGGTGDSTGGVLDVAGVAGEGQDRPVVVLVGVEVEQVGTGGRDDRVERIAGVALTDVDGAGEHTEASHDGAARTSGATCALPGIRLP
jgi:hypothetical protein